MRHPKRDDADKNIEPSPLEIVQRVIFLVLDEVGTHPLANDERLLLDELIKERYDHRRPLSSIAIWTWRH